jgi:hypothetical protein
MKFLILTFVLLLSSQAHSLECSKDFGPLQNFIFDPEFKMGYSQNGYGFADPQQIDLSTGKFTKTRYNNQVVSSRVGSNTDMGLSPDGETLMASTNFEVIFWDAETGKQLWYDKLNNWRLEHPGGGYQVAMSPDNLRVGLVHHPLTYEDRTRNFEVTVFEVGSDKNLYHSKIKYQSRIALSNDPNIIYVITGQILAKKEISTDKILLQAPISYNNIDDVDLHVLPNGNLVTTVSSRELKVISAVDFKQIFSTQTSYLETNRVFRSITRSSDSKFVSHFRGAVLNLETGKHVVGSGQNASVGQGFSPDGTKFARVDEYGKLEIFDTANWQLLSESCIERKF